MPERTANWNQPGNTNAAGEPAGEWPALYAQFMLRAAGQSTRTSTLYQAIMDCVARGELPPTVFQDMAPAFIQARGPAYSQQLAEVSSRYFGGLVALNHAAVQALLTSTVAAADPAPPLPSPKLDPTDPIRWYQQLTEYAGQLAAHTASAYRALLERVAAGELAPSEVQAASSAYLAQRLPEQLNQLSSLSFDLLNGLNDLRAGNEEAFLAAVLATAQKPGQEAPPALNLVAPLGGNTATSLVLSNTRPEPATIRCTVTDLRRADGVGPAFAPKLVVVPDDLLIPPGGQGTLVLSLRLDADHFTPNVLYVGTVHIEREGEPRLELPLRVTATPADPPPPQTRRKPTRRKAAPSPP